MDSRAYEMDFKQNLKFSLFLALNQWKWCAIIQTQHTLIGYDQILALFGSSALFSGKFPQFGQLIVNDQRLFLPNWRGGGGGFTLGQND